MVVYPLFVSPSPFPRPGFRTIVVFKLDAEFMRDEDGSQVGAQDRPEDWHGHADGRYVDFKNHEQDALGAVPCRVAGRVEAGFVVDGLVDAPAGKSDNPIQQRVRIHFCPHKIYWHEDLRKLT